MKTIYLLSQLKPSGPVNQALNLVTGFDRSEVQPLVVTLFDEDTTHSWRNKYEQQGVEVVCLHSTRQLLREAARQLDRVIAERDIQIVHSSGLSADTVNCHLKSNVRKFTTIRSHLADLAEKRPFIVRLIARRQYKHNMRSIDVRVACSKALAESSITELCLPCECVQNGVDTDHYTPVPTGYKPVLRDLLRLPKNKRIYLSVGVMYRRKQMLKMAESFISAGLKDAVMAIVGDGEEYDDVKQLADSNDNIILCGRQKDPLMYYQCADVFVSASLAEGLPNAVLEAMACGLPVILSDIGPHCEFFDGTHNIGITFECGNYIELVEKFNQSVSWGIPSMQREALETIQKHFSKYEMAKKYTKLYTR